MLPSKPGYGNFQPIMTDLHVHQSVDQCDTEFSLIMKIF